MPEPKAAGPFPPITNPAPLVCVPPEAISCTADTPGAPVICRCVLVSTPSPKLCTVSMVYAEGSPQGVYVGPMEQGCSVASAELALAILLTKFLQGVMPPLP